MKHHIFGSLNNVEEQKKLPEKGCPLFSTKASTQRKEFWNLHEVGTKAMN